MDIKYKYSKLNQCKEILDDLSEKIPLLKDGKVWGSGKSTYRDVTQLFGVKYSTYFSFRLRMEIYNFKRWFALANWLYLSLNPKVELQEVQEAQARLQVDTANEEYKKSKADKDMDMINLDETLGEFKKDSQDIAGKYNDTRNPEYAFLYVETDNIKKDHVLAIRSLNGSTLQNLFDDAKSAAKQAKNEGTFSEYAELSNMIEEVINGTIRDSDVIDISRLILWCEPEPVVGNSSIYGYGRLNKMSMETSLINYLNIFKNLGTVNVDENSIVELRRKLLELRRELLDSYRKGTGAFTAR